jgi:filamentous hemagglutinin family protein
MKRHGSLNHIFRLVWSQVLGCWVAVAENSRGRGKSASRKLIAATLSLTGVAALAAPMGGQVIAGSAGIAQSGSTTTITQTSQNVALNWNSFNIGAKETVNFVQPGVSSIAVNRILDTGGSQIMGQLNANGQVFLINPNGILFGQGAQVNVGGLVASTLDFNQASIDGNVRTFGGSGKGAIVNQGTINAASGGYVALLGNRVSNTGTITAPRGSVVLGAGSAATLTFSANHLTHFEISQSTLDNLADNGGLIQADGGMVILSAGARNEVQASVVNNSGVIRARTVDNVTGNITVLGSMVAGTANIAGTLDASAPDGGNGGFIDTSAAHVKIADGTKVTTLAANGNSGTWLIDPTDFTIGSGNATRTDSSIGAVTLSENLADGNVTIATATATVASGTGKGDINVDADVTWSRNQLKLTADNDININAVMTANDSASLNLQPGSGKVNVGLDSSGFKGRVDFFAADGVTARTGTGFLTIGAYGYTIINSIAGLSTPGHYALGGDIVGGPGGSITSFNNSTFDGLGHTISGLVITKNGLFGSISNTTIRNVGLVKDSVTHVGSVTGGAGTGALVGEITTGSTISNSYSTLDVTGGAGTGGLVGRVVGDGASSISNSHATGTVTGGAGTGGLVGSIAGPGGSSISDSYATGAVKGDAGTGGLVGSIAGAASGNASHISNSHATGTVVGNAATGGLVGSMAGHGAASNISNSYATGNVGNTAGGAGTGGLVGSLATGSGNISDSYASGNVISTGAATGGLVGSTSASGTIINSCSSGDVLGDGAGAGGLVGSSADSGAIRFSYATGNVESVGAGTGGLVGSNTSGAIHGSFASGNVNGGGAGTGGLVGSNTGGAISQSFAVGNVTGAASSIADRVAVTKGASTGGLVGSNSGTLTDTYASGTVTGYAAGVGGLVGDNFGTVSNSYAVGMVTGGTGATGVGGLIGFGTGTGTDSNSYRLAGNTTLIGSATTAPSQASTAISSSDFANFITSTATNNGGNPAWDFINVWKAGAGGPVLKDINHVLKTFATSVTKTYDGTAYSGPTSLSSLCCVKVASVSLASSGVNAGTYSMTPLLVLENSALASYFSVTPVTLTITKRALELSTIDVTKSYDGGLSASGTAKVISGTLVTGDTLSGGTFGFTDKNAGNGNKTVTSSDVTVGYGTNNANYNISYANNTSSTITKADLTLTGLSADNKVYNANTVATLSGKAAVKALTGDDITLDGIASGVFADKNVDTGKTVTVSGNTIGGADALNYNLVQPTSLKADISKADLVLTGLSADNKVYNANTVATLSGKATVKALTGDDITLDGIASGAFADKNVDTGKRVTVSGNTISGLDAGNYNLVQQTSLKADISKSQLTLSSDNVTKSYDGGLSATGATTRVSSGTLFTGDALIGGTFAFIDKNVGNGNKTVATSAVTVGDGTNNGNYNVSYANNTTSTITAKALTVSGLVASDKAYDGNATAVVSGGTIGGLIAGEALDLNAQFADGSAGRGKAVTLAGVSTETGLASNYSLIQPANLTAAIIASFVAPPAVVQPAAEQAVSANFLSSVSTKPAMLSLSPPITVTRSSSVESSTATATATATATSAGSGTSTGEASVGNAAEAALSGSGSADKISSSTMLGLNAALKIVDGGVMLQNNTENKP